MAGSGIQFNPLASASSQVRPPTQTNRNPLEEEQDGAFKAILAEFKEQNGGSKQAGNRLIATG